MGLIINCTESSSYVDRTKYNADSTDLTIAFARDFTTAGEKLTKKLAGSKYLKIPLSDNMKYITVVDLITSEIKKRDVKTINIAGNGIYTLSKYGYTQEKINYDIYIILRVVFEIYPYLKVYTGGQTGVDLAGAVAGYRYGQEVEVTMPAGYKQRYIDRDVYNSEEEIRYMIIEYSDKLLNV
jgi:hypothetical protein